MTTYIRKHLKHTLNNIEVSNLFKSGKWIATQNISAIYSKSNDFKYMVSAPMKNFKRATHRNKIKRFLRQGILKSEVKNVNIAFIYKSTTILDSKQIESEIKKLLNRI